MKQKNSQQPEVIACQGGGETVVAHNGSAKSFVRTTDESFGRDSQNPPADNFKIKRTFQNSDGVLCVEVRI